MSLLSCLSTSSDNSMPKMRFLPVKTDVQDCQNGRQFYLLCPASSCEPSPKRDCARRFPFSRNATGRGIFMLHHVLVCRACMYFLMPALAFRRLAYVVAPSLCCCFVCLLCFTARSLADSLCTYVRSAVETRGHRSRIVRNRCVPVCGYRAGYFWLGLAQLWAQIRFEIGDFRPDPYKFSGPFEISRGLTFQHPIWGVQAASSLRETHLN